MWPKFYKDYPVDTPLIKYPVRPSKGIIGCQMHEINGWGDTIHHFRKHKKRKKKGYLTWLIESIFSKKKKV